MSRLTRRLVLTLVAGVLLGAFAAALLGQVLDAAVHEQTRRNLEGTLERLEHEFRVDLRSGAADPKHVQLAARQSGARVTLIAADGRVIADSEVDAVKLPTVENHATRPEIVAARRDGIGVGERRSATVQEPYVYAARRVGPAEAPEGFVRLAARLGDLDALEAPFRRTLERIAVGAGLVVAFLVLVIRQRHTLVLDRVRDGVAVAAEGRRPELPGRSSAETQDVFVALDRFADLVAKERQGSERARLLSRTVFEEVPAGLVVVDASLMVLDANPAAFRLLSAPAAARPMALVELVRDPAAVALFARGTSAGEGEAPVSGVVRLDAGSARERVLEIAVRALPHTASAGEPAAVGVVSDATERERTDALRRRFVADVSHELRTPIAAIRAASETLAGEEGLSADLARLVGIVRRQAAEMEDLVSDLTDLSQIETGTVTLQIDRVALEPILEDVVQGLGTVAEARHLNVTLRAEIGLAVRGDRRRLAQVFRNLVDNAIKFSPPGATVELEAFREADGRARVDVFDHGIGIPKKEQASIFQRFYRVDPSRTKATPGTGLGLAIVKHLLILHGGGIEVASEPGRGSRFTVRLPAEAPDEIRPPETT